MPQLSEKDRETLLQIARSSVHAHLANEVPRPPEMESDPAGYCGVFVSIHRGTDLRGCVGTIEPQESLHRSIARCAVAAASRDTRFTPVQLPELPELQFEISVLYQLQDVIDIGAIEIGVHGLVISRGNARGLLLPQVAVQYRWDREQFFNETSRKAGLPPGAWKQGARIQSFIAEVFS
jgi:AmmeMemoRadiSam system protein A